MAKFKVGDHVNYGPGAAVDFIGTVTKVYPDGQYFDMKTNDGRTVDHLPIKDAVVTNRIVSTNAVVANALAARTARNAEYKVGDKVILPSMDGGKRIYTVFQVNRGGYGWYGVEDEHGSCEVVRASELKPAKNALAARGAVANFTWKDNKGVEHDSDDDGLPPEWEKAAMRLGDITDKYTSTFRACKQGLEEYVAALNIDMAMAKKYGDTGYNATIHMKTANAALSAMSQFIRANRI